MTMLVNKLIPKHIGHRRIKFGRRRLQITTADTLFEDTPQSGYSISFVLVGRFHDDDGAITGTVFLIAHI